MINAFVVIATKDTEVEVCEVFEDEQKARDRGYDLAVQRVNGNQGLLTAYPHVDYEPTGTLKFVFLDTNRQSVVVLQRSNILENAIILDPSLPARGTLHPVAPAPPPYDPEDRRLPAGWTYHGYAITMAELQDNPDNAKDHLDLTDAQKWALVTARVKKSPGYRQIPQGYSGYTVDQSTALGELSAKTQLGEQIRDAEIQMLSELRSHYGD